MLNVKTGKRELRREDIDPQQSILSQRKDPDQYPELSFIGDQYSKIRLYRDWGFGRASSPPAWDHVFKREGDQRHRPDGVRDEQLHWMVQAMEAWLVADPEALAAYYKQGFRRDALPRQSNVEQVAKRELYDALDRATSDSKTKGKYAKSHGFELIGLVDPNKVRAASGHAARFFDTLADHAAAGPS